MKKIAALPMLMMLLFFPSLAFAKVQLPSSVYNISKENTATHTSIEDAVLEPNKLAKELIKSSNVEIQNPKLVELFNESQVGKNPVAFWYNASIYLGSWPLNYTSEESTPIWEYQKINTNALDNHGGKEAAMLNYHQQAYKDIKGQVAPAFSRDVKKMILKSATKSSGLPLTLKAKIGEDTTLENKYQVPISKAAVMNAYAPVLHEKGKVTFGEVYIILKGNKKMVEVKNVSAQNVNAWLPIQDHVSLKMQLSTQ